MVTKHNMSCSQDRQRDLENDDTLLTSGHKTKNQSIKYMCYIYYDGVTMETKKIGI